MAGAMAITLRAHETHGHMMESREQEARAGPRVLSRQPKLARVSQCQSHGEGEGCKYHVAATEPRW
jgi:hypothetical protein